MKYQKNDDGSLVLDADGNPIVELTDEEKEAARDKESLVGELKDLRTKYSITKDLLDKSKEVTPPPPKTPETEDEKIAQKVREVLDSEKASNAQANKKAAFEKFVKENKEFNPENDPTGLKQEALKSKFNRFNSDGLTTIEEFTALIGEAKILLVGNDSQPETPKVTTPYSSTPTPRGNPPAKNDEVLTPKELKLAEQTGRTKEEVIKLKLKHPDLIRDLLEFVRD